MGQADDSSECGGNVEGSARIGWQGECTGGRGNHLVDIGFAGDSVVVNPAQGGIAGIADDVDVLSLCPVPINLVRWRQSEHFESVTAGIEEPACAR